jgi:hypothetical protein
MHGNRKMRPVEMVPGMGGGRIIENDGGMNLFMIYCKNFGKSNNVFQYSNNEKKKKERV